MKNEKTYNIIYLILGIVMMFTFIIPLAGINYVADHSYITNVSSFYSSNGHDIKLNAYNFLFAIIGGHSAVNDGVVCMSIDNVFNGICIALSIPLTIFIIVYNSLKVFMKKDINKKAEIWMLVLITVLSLIFAIGLFTISYRVGNWKGADRNGNYKPYKTYWDKEYYGNIINGILFIISSVIGGLILLRQILIFKAKSITTEIEKRNDGKVLSMERDLTKELAKWKELLDKGIITQEEFEEKKRKILEE